MSRNHAPLRRSRVQAQCRHERGRRFPRRCTAERRIRARPSVNAHPDMSARARAPPPGSSGATTDTDRPHGRRVRQTSLPRHSSGRSTERPFRFVVDHTVRPRPAVPSREGTPAEHDQHRRPARDPPARPDKALPTLGALPRACCRGPTRTHTTDTDDNPAVGLSPRLRLRSLGRPLPPRSVT